MTGSEAPEPINRKWYDSQNEEPRPASAGRGSSWNGADIGRSQFGTVGFWVLAAPFWMPWRKSTAAVSCLSLAGSGGT